MTDAGDGRSVVIAAGGTGGHIFPGLALAGALRRAAPGARVSFVGTPRGLERTLIPDAGYELRMVDMLPASRALGLRLALLPAALARSTVQAWRILRAEHASVAVSMGAYAGLPLILAARAAGIPSLIHESGAVPGRANRLAAHLTRNVAVAFEETAHLFSCTSGARVVGMPLDPQVAHVDRAALRMEARTSLDLPADGFVVLVNGGSQGAARLNEAAIGLAARWRDRSDVRVLVKAGRESFDAVREALARAGAERTGRCVAFFERMDHAYAAADLAVCRAGAGTVAELAAAGLPAILVPYPHAPGDHQARNAGPLVRAGAAFMTRDPEATAENLGPMVEELLANPSRLTSMGEAARATARPDAAENLAAWVLALAEGEEAEAASVEEAATADGTGSEDRAGADLSGGGE